MSNPLERFLTRKTQHPFRQRGHTQSRAPHYGEVMRTRAPLDSRWRKRSTGGGGASKPRGEMIPLASCLRENCLLAFLCERDLAPLLFHQSFSHHFVNCGLQGVFPWTVVA